MDKAKRFLVTGARGYVGGRLVTYLAERGHQVTAVTRGQCPESPSDCIRWISVSWDDASGLSELVNDIDVVVHLAAPNEIICGKDHVEAVRGTVEPTLALIAAAKEVCEHFIYFSTAHVYGAPLQGRLTEDVAARPSHPYSIAHRCAEDFVLAAGDREAFKATVFRLSNSLGTPDTPEVDRWSLISNDLSRQAAQSGKIVLHSQGRQTRDFIAMNDVCRAVDHVASSEAAWQSEIYNLGSGTTLSMRQIAEWVADAAESVSGKRPAIEYGEADPAAVELDYSMEKFANIGFIPQGDIQKEVAETVARCFEWFAPVN